MTLLPFVKDDVVMDDFVRWFVIEETTHIEAWQKMLHRPGTGPQA